MFEPVWTRIARGAYVQRPARLHGFTRRRARGDVYPVIFKSRDADWVDGILYLDVDEKDLHRLDVFEGEPYERQTHTVVVENAEKMQACVYVLKENWIWMANHVPWDPNYFAREGLKYFMKHYIGFR
jgi:gamma-glutamylcyclotransferase (GGCT)/AIG2-like uncharacterized protein YtfP